MYRYTFNLFLLFFFFICVAFGQTSSQPEGNGTSGSPFLISSLENLYWISQNTGEWVSGKYFKQTDNIDASPTLNWFSDGNGGYYGFPPIGGDDSSNGEISGQFNGNYDGDNYKIDNLFINRLNDKIGLFGNIGTASIKNLKINNAYVRSRSGNEPYGFAVLVGYSNSLILENTFVLNSNLISDGASGAVGGMLGWVNNLTATNCGVDVNIDMNSSGFVGVGGFAGLFAGTVSITNSYSIGTISSTVGRVGGFVGDVTNSSNVEVSNSFSSVDIESTSGIIGGFVGMLYKRMRFNNCYSSGDVSGLNNVGGFFGWTWNNSGVADTIFENCYSSGALTVSGSSSIGGFGSTTHGYSGITFTNSYWNSETSNSLVPTSDTPISSGIISLTSNQMKIGSNFNNWDFEGVSLDGNNEIWKYDSNINAGLPSLNNLTVFSNTVPANIFLSSFSVNENVVTGTVIGVLSTSDSDSGDTHTYTLVSGNGDTDNASFNISGDNLLTNTTLDYETKNSYSILIQTTDSASATYTKSFTITVNDVDEDSDGDGITNNLDNCPSTANADQLDSDLDGIGDVCDNAPSVSNANQLDTDGDGIGDVIDLDDDNDGCIDSLDDFPIDPSECSDSDGDGIGDNADTDLDNDGALDTEDNCLYTPNADQLDTDGDGIGNACDPDNDNDGFSDTDEITCGSDPLLASSLPADTDSDGIPDCIDTDDDNDGFSDTDEATCGSDPLDVTSMPLDTDTDGTPNCIDPDDDNDRYLDVNDAFPLDATEWLDTDADGIGNNADTDDDGDGQFDTDEITCGSDPLLATSMSLDTDGDTIPDCLDTDDDNDGVVDTEDAFPLDQAEWTDTDSDGIGNNADTDDDNDGQSDYNELVCGSDPLDQYSRSSDIDSDNIPDCVDEDIDGDGYLNEEDAFPENGSEWLDTDADGLGNNFDVDDDNDGCLDSNDAFPLNPSECSDADNDGIGDNEDPDDNNDGFEDNKLFASGALTPGSGGLEETWKIINIERYPNARVTVYNKNGQEVFSALAYRNDWRGTFKKTGDFLPAASYYYVVDPNNGEEPINGWLYITY